ncbi:zinc finger FYVE domain-containing protein 16-like isoform X2 [Megalops cyprinoides]|uniref:zinc finger FYVE domain-containing protein 16-like isoform X2 n=1 Tax=Megalops cyprinoides TaxID=118141 RepID=UPI001864A8B0|nr:zinc finger FYVE domain-containing protein 16-like isoform X2 [Megalops cyprinoides]
MDRFFRAAVCDLDRLLDDFEQNAELNCRATAAIPCSSVFPGPSHNSQCFVPETSSPPSAVPDVNSLRYGSSVTYSDPVPTCSLYPGEEEAEGKRLTGVDLLSSVDCRTANGSVPPCPDGAQKPVCDLVSDTGPSLLFQANGHDAFKELDIAERQLQEGLLVDFDSPVVSPSVDSLKTGESWLGQASQEEGNGHAGTEGHLASLGLLDIILPTATAESVGELQDVARVSQSEALGSSERDEEVEEEEKVEVLQNGEHLEADGVPPSAEAVSLDLQGEGVEERDGVVDTPEHRGAEETGEQKSDEEQQELNQGRRLGHGGGLDSPSPSAPLEDSCIPSSCPPKEPDCILSYPSAAVSMCGSLIDSAERMGMGEEEEGVASDPCLVADSSLTEVQVQRVFSVDDAVNNVSHAGVLAAPESNADESVSEACPKVTPVSHLNPTPTSLETPKACLSLVEKVESEGSSPPDGSLSPEPLPDFAFVDDSLPESERARVLVTDEDLDGFLKEQAESDTSGRPVEKHADEGFSEMNGDLEESRDLSPDYKDSSFEKREFRNATGSDAEGFDAKPPSEATGDEDSYFSSPSLDQSPCEVELLDRSNQEKESCSSPGQVRPVASQHPYFGGARPKQLQFSQPPQMSPTRESDGRERSENLDGPAVNEATANEVHTPPPAAVLGGDVSSHSATSPSHAHQDRYKNSFYCEEVSEPPPSPCTPEDTVREETAALDWPVSDDQGVGSRPPSWVPDSEAPNCMNCTQRFTFTRRRHHCRACGKVYCTTCCGRKCRLKYLERTARVCVVCYETIHRVQAFERMMSPTGPSPNPNVPSEYCSTIPPMQQARASGTLNSPPPTVMVPVSVLKQPGSEGFPREQRRVWFADGLLPNGELADTARLSTGGKRGSQDLSSVTLDPPVVKSKLAPLPAETRRGRAEAAGAPGRSAGAPEGVPRPPISGPWDYSLLCRVAGCVGKAGSLLPEDEEGLPPLLIITEEDGGADVLVEERPSPNQILLLLEEGGPCPLTFVLSANLLVNIKLVSYCGRKCWCFSSSGLQGVGQQELVFVIVCLPEENSVPKDIFSLYVRIYQDAQSGRFVEDLGSVTFTESFLGSREHGGFLFFAPTLQPLEGLAVPPAPFLCGVLVHKLEVPWAKVFPLRLLLRLGAEYSAYPSPLLSVRSRRAVFGETGHTIMNLLADLRNYQYSLPVVEGLHIHMEMGNSYIHIPKAKVTEMLKVVNSANEHVISVGASFSREADSHLVCFQNDDGNYQTQANSMPGTTRKVTGASFVVFNGALKASSGFIAKSSIVEDGLMVQIPPDTMEALRQAIREQRDFQIPCGRADSEEARENINVCWVDRPLLTNSGMSSPVDGRSLEGALRVRMEQDAEFEMDGKVIKCTEVFYLLRNPGGCVSAAPPPDGQFPREIATAACATLCPNLTVLKDSGINRLALRVSADADMVEYQAGSGGRLLPQRYMNDLDSSLIPVIHGGSASVPQEPTEMELTFYITEILC